jgi:hypothetical protein
LAHPFPSGSQSRKHGPQALLAISGKFLMAV